MALVNPQIAMSYRPTTEYQPRNALAEYAQIQSIVGGQRQAEAAEMQLESLRRERDALGQIQAAITAKGGPPDLAAAADAMIKTGKPEYLTQGMAIRTALENQRKAAQYFKDLEPPTAAPANAMTAPAPQGELVAAPIAPPTGTVREIAPGGAMGAPMSLATNALAPAAAAAAPVNAMAAPDAMMAQRQALEARLRRIGNNPELKAEREMLLKQYESLLAGAAPPADVRTMQLLGFPATTEGYRQYRAAQMAPPQPRAPVAVLQNGRPVYVSPEQAVGQTPFTPASVQVLGMGPGREPAAAASQKAPAGYRFTPSGDLEPIPGGPASPGLAPKDIQKREAAFPQATQSVKGFVTKSNQFITELERLRDDPGLDQITGPIYGRTPSVSRAGSRAQALYDKIFAKGGFQALQDMREASKTGGALGNVSNEEGRRLEKSVVGGLDRTQNIADVRQGINDLIDEIRTSQARVQEAYDTTYEYRAQRGGGAAAKQMSPQDKQALDWANSNPKDPRAAQIKARLGVQ